MPVRVSSGDVLGDGIDGVAGAGAGAGEADVARASLLSIARGCALSMGIIVHCAMSKAF